MARIYYSKATRLNTQVKYEGKKSTELGYEVPEVRANLLEVCHINNYNDEEKETYIKEVIAKIDNIQRAKHILLPIKADRLCWVGGKVDHHTPTPLEGFLMAAKPSRNRKGDLMTGKISKFKKSVFLTSMRNVVFEEVPKGTEYSIDVDAVVKGAKAKSDAKDKEDTISETINDEGKEIKMVGKKVGRKRKQAIAV